MPRLSGAAFFPILTCLETTDVGIFAGIPKRDDFNGLVGECCTDAFGVLGVIVNENDRFELSDVA